MRVLIAGASGEIGRALVRRLRANQREVFALTQSRDYAVVLKGIGAELWCPSLADSVREPEGYLGGDRRRSGLMLSSMKRLPVSTAFRSSMSCRSLEVPSSFYSRSDEGEPQLAGA